MSAWLCDPRLALCLWIVSGHLDFPPGVLSCLKPRNLCPGLSLSLCVYQRERTGGGAALMRINLWIVLVVLMALLAVTQLLRYRQVTQRICADDPSASVCGR